MDIINFIGKAIQVEETIAECYAALAKRCEPGYAARLERLSNEEINHRNILNMAKTIVVRAPDLFGEVTMPEKDLEEGRRGLGPLLETIGLENSSWWDSLAKLKELETNLERVHMNVSITIRDPSLRALFKALSAGDQTHESILSGILSESPGCRLAATSGRVPSAP